jgi:succinate dehydrogenase / fumarate reductase cytochrome b subunit
MATGNRPLSPHLQVYRPQLTSMLSIIHRLTGVALAVGALLFTYWLTAAAYGPEAYDRAQAFMGSWFGNLILFGWTFALFYHLCNGIRHMAWDIGLGFGMQQLNRSGILMVVVSVGLTGLTWAAAYWPGGF